jgi:hypothetical protein
MDGNDRPKTARRSSNEEDVLMRGPGQTLQQLADDRLVRVAHV